MTDKNDTQTETSKETLQPQTMQVGIRMQQGEHTGQPIYSNFTAVQDGEGIVFIDFGFLEPQAMQALARMTQSGKKVPETISARMSCRMVISVDAAANLERQLNQLFRLRTAKAEDIVHSDQEATLQ